MPANKAPHRFVVIAEFKVRDGHLVAFLKLAREDAERSVADEPGCLQFDVAVSDEDPHTVVFYEVYGDRAAFDAHLAMPHFTRFQEGFPALIVEQKARFLKRHYA